MKLSRESAKGVIGVAKAFGISILLLDQTSIAGVDRFRSHRLTNVAADKHFSDAASPQWW